MGKKLKFDREIVYSENPPFPHNMLVELTNFCNHSCIFCGHRKMLRKQQFCNKEKMMNIIEQAYSNGTREIGFYLAGEPFLSKDLEYFVEQCKTLGFEYIYITTNGAYATKERVKKLCELGLSSIKFSVDAANRDTYKYIHGKDDYEKVIGNLKGMIELKNEGLDFGLFASFCVLKKNKQEVETFTEQFGKYLDDICITQAFEQCGNTSDIIDELIDPNTKLGKVPCEMIFNCLHITCEGYLNACCIDIDNMLAVADLNQISVLDAWNCDRLVELRREHLSSKIGNNMCFNCIYGNGEKNIRPLSLELVSNMEGI